MKSISPAFGPHVQNKLKQPEATSQRLCIIAIRLRALAVPDVHLQPAQVALVLVVRKHAIPCIHQSFIAQTINQGSGLHGLFITIGGCQKG